MNLTLKNVIICGNPTDISVTEGKLFLSSNQNAEVDFSGAYLFPGFCDVHVHFREPGFSYKETIRSGSLAAARGGYTSVCAMPNLNPCPDTLEHLAIENQLIADTAAINVFPYAAITIGQKGKELSDMSSLKKSGAIAFSDDGVGVQSEEIMREAFAAAKRENVIIAAHCEDNSLLCGGYIHDGIYAQRHGHKGISSESEYAQIERDLKLCKEIGNKYHVCHISTKESVCLIRQAKKEGVNVTCETAPHYLVLCDEDLQDDGRYKMNPPLRSKRDRDALIEGIIDGTIDMIATDHAPHTIEEKSLGLKGSKMGVSGLECAFPVLYTEFVKKNVITLDKLIELMSENPRKRFGIGGGLVEGKTADFTIFDLDAKYKVRGTDFVSMGKITPFEGREVYGRCLMTVANGGIAWKTKTER